MTAPTAERGSASPFRSPGEAQLLIVEDDPALVRVLSAGFSACGYRATSATTGGDAMAQVDRDDPDVIILDLGLPDIDGLDLCRHLRLWCPAPIVVLSADGSEDRKIQALDLGADDYLTKPFSMPELLARVRVAVRHRRNMPPVAEGTLRVGALTVDLRAHAAALGGRPLDLAPKELALLVLLARHAGSVLTHRVIMEQVWGSYERIDTLRVHVSVLRRKLGTGPAAPQITTEAGVGYRLIDPDEDPAAR
jgi:two-component system KDP operon response regulator KdpE